MEPTADDPVVINPLNGIAMEKLDIGGVRIDRCPETGAIWLDRGELARVGSLGKKYQSLLKQLDKPSKQGRKDRVPRGELVSPENRTEMMIVVRDDQQRHIEFEMCPVSGGCFFDAGELSDLTDFSFVERLKAFFH
ncbi:MAG: zf-TFIIB domain-containing protein [Phycisphaerales bacterium]|nr:zf-TFIIB domain-containing protein [Phycisphaerales bacterium]